MTFFHIKEKIRNYKEKERLRKDASKNKIKLNKF